MTPADLPDAPVSAARRAAPRLIYTATLAGIMGLSHDRLWSGGVWDALTAIVLVALVRSVFRCLTPSWWRYVRTGEKTATGWLASEPAGEFDVVLDAPGRRPIMIMRVLRQATGEPLAPIKTAVEGAPGTVVRGVSAPSADRLVVALVAAGASAHTQSGSSPPTI